MITRGERLVSTGSCMMAFLYHVSSLPKSDAHRNHDYRTEFIYLFSDSRLPISSCKSVLTSSVIGLSTLTASVKQVSFHATSVYGSTFCNLQLQHKIELLPTPVLHTPRGHFLPLYLSYYNQIPLCFLFSSSNLWFPTLISIMIFSRRLSLLLSAIKI